MLNEECCVLSVGNLLVWEEVFSFSYLPPSTCLEWGYNGKTKAALLDWEVALRMEATNSIQPNKGSFLSHYYHTSPRLPYLQVPFMCVRERFLLVSEFSVSTFLI